MFGYRLRRQIHTSWIIAMFCFGVVVGVISSQYVNSALFYSFVWLLLGGVVFGIAIWKRYLIFVPIVIMAGLSIGLWRGSSDQAKLAIYQNLIGITADIEGTVSEDVDLNKRHESVLRLSDLNAKDHKLPGVIYATTHSNKNIKRGDRVTIYGKLNEGFGTFSATIYQARIVSIQRPQPGDIARQMRDWFADAVRVVIPEPQASLGIGYLVGQRRALPPELDEALRIAGLTHIVVASGYNLTILVRFARRSFEGISKYLAMLWAGTMIISFVAITGLSPSMSRAGLIAGLALAAWYYGRNFHPIILLLFAAAVTLLINPSFGWNDLGWQLSFAAFAGVMIVAPLLQAYFFGDKKPGIIRQILGETVSAQIVTAPILILAFGSFSNVAIVANLLVLPFVPLAMLLTFISGAGALLFLPLGQLVALPTSWLLGYMTNLAEYVAHLPWAQTELSITWWHVAVAYGVIVITCVYIWEKTNYNFRNSSIIE